jgi:hypothetical protein
MLWRTKNKFKTVVRKIELLQFDLNVGFLFRLLILRNLFTETAGMFAVERALNGALQRRRMEILCQHRRPRHRLEREPMRAGRRQYGNNHQHMAKFAEHNHTMFERNGRVKGSHLTPESKRACRWEFCQTAESNRHPPNECNRMRTAFQCSIDPPCHECKCSAHANPPAHRD